MTKDVIECIKERRTVRKFKSDPVPEATIGRLIEAARCAPSAGGIQPWHFTVVLGGSARRELASATAGQGFIADAPVCIIVSTEPEQSAAKFGNRGEDLYCIQDAAAATQNLLLAATAFGLGSCWVGAFDEQAVKQVAQLPEDFKPVAIIPVGYPAEAGEDAPLRSQEEVTRILR